MSKKFALKSCGIAAFAAFGALSSPAQALTFIYDFTPGTSVAEQNAFIAAGDIWSSIFADNVSVILTVGTANLGAGILAQASSTQNITSYSDFSNVLTNDATSVNDGTAVLNLQGGPALGMLINGTADNPHGAGSLTPYLDSAGANNTTIRLTTANAKALGFTPTLGNADGNCLALCDGFIQFNSDFAFDLDPADGIGAGMFDFIGIAAHEIGHALGFISGVDVLDFNSPPVGGPFFADQFTFVNTLDVFRFSTASAAQGAIDFTVGSAAKYFSIDGGATAIAGFSTGSFHGDSRQASHFKDGLGLGVMDPTAGPGELLAITGNDVLAFDVIGWDLRPAVPEPSSWMLMIAGFGMAGAAVRRRTVSVRLAL